MKRLLLILAFVSVLILPGIAMACTTTTIMGPDGRMVICLTCCYGGNCTVTCF